MGGVVSNFSASAQTTIGATDNTTGFNAARSQYYTIANNQKLYLEFTNNSSKANVWNNWVLFAYDDAQELACLRADNWVLSGSLSGSTKKYATERNDDTFKSNMDGATVKMTILREDGHVFVHAIMTKGGVANPWVQSYWFNLPDAQKYTENFKVCLSVDNSHIIIDDTKTATSSTTAGYYTVAPEANDAPYAVYFSDNYEIALNQTIKLHFKNYTLGANNFENWVAFVATKKQGENGNYEAVALRADNWNNITNGNVGITSNYDWGTFKADMEGSDVIMTVSHTTTGFTVHADITTTSGKKYFEEYTGNYSWNDPFYFYLSVEKAHLQIQSAEVVEVSEYGWSTFSSDVALDFTNVDESLKAYMISGVDGTAIQKVQVTGTVPAGTGLLLNGTPNQTYTIPVALNSATDVSANCLQPGTGASVTTATGRDRFVLSVSGGKAVFQLLGATAATVAKGKAYLDVPAASTARSLYYLDDDVTGISQTSVATEGQTIVYDLQGRRVANPTKGVYIVNGKKVVIK